MPRAVLIILSGLPGTGKTTIARELARRIDAMHIRIDSIEHAIRESGVVAGSLDDAGYRVGYAVAEDNLRIGRTVIADSVNPLPLTRDAWLAVSRSAGVNALEIEIICSDPREHQRRVETRIADIAAFRLPAWPEVLDRAYQPWTRQRIVVDTAVGNVDECVALLQTELRSLSGADSR
jgi:predicted kinase